MRLSLCRLYGIGTGGVGGRSTYLYWKEGPGSGLRVGRELTGTTLWIVVETLS